MVWLLGTRGPQVLPLGARGVLVAAPSGDPWGEIKSLFRGETPALGCAKVPQSSARPHQPQPSPCAFTPLCCWRKLPRDHPTPRCHLEVTQAAALLPAALGWAQDGPAIFWEDLKH